MFTSRQRRQKLDVSFSIGLKRLYGFLEVTAAQVHNGNYAKWFGINKWYQSFALRNFDLEDMELESTNSGPTAKLPILKLGEYEMWAIRIKQYFQIQDYALWEVIENEEKTNKNNDVKARGLLLMELPNEHQLTFNQYPDAKSMFDAIETRFGGNAATKKTQKTLLKQQYENFSATSAESLDSIFNRLQKILNRLAILGVIIAQEDLNLKFLSSLPPKWNTHVVVWMNKPKVETMSIDDLYNNFKIVEQKVKKTVGTSSGGQNLAIMTAPSSSGTNDANTACSQVSAASTSVNIASPQVCTASVSDNTVYAFMVENPNGSNVLHQDLEQIHEDDLEAMDLKWQLSLLSVRVKKYYQRTSKKIFINGNDIAGYDKSKVECYNCHKLGYFARECGAPRSKEEEQVHTNMALMAFSDSEASTYKRGLDTVEAQLITYRKNEVLFSEEVAILKTSKDLDQLLGSQITDKSKKGLGYSTVLPPHPLIYNRPNKLDLSYSGLDEFKEPEFKGHGPENSKQESNVVCENESNNSKENSDKSLVKEQVSQDKSSFVEGYGPNTSKSVSEEEPKKVRKNAGAPIIEDWVSDDEEQDESKPKSEKKTVIPTAPKIESQSLGGIRGIDWKKSNPLGKDLVDVKTRLAIMWKFYHLQLLVIYNHQRRGRVDRHNYTRVDAKIPHLMYRRNMSSQRRFVVKHWLPGYFLLGRYTDIPKNAVHSAKFKKHFSKQYTVNC
ncbi:retrovirus-related pol polyprotein from transposon TNT 1-94 [Tanacetum coccineum]